MTEIPKGYWGEARWYYCRDHETPGWSVSNGGLFIPAGDKSVAAAIACLLNGDVACARTFLDGLPDKL